VGDRLSPGVMNPSLAIARSGIWPKRPNRGSGLSWASTCSVGYTEIARVENLRRPKFFERYSRPWQRAPAFRWRRLSSAERARAALPRRSGAHAGGGRRDPPPWVLMALTGAARSPSRSCPRGPLRRGGPPSRAGDPRCKDAAHDVRVVGASRARDAVCTAKHPSVPLHGTTVSEPTVPLGCGNQRQSPRGAVFLTCGGT
jgi:hypothetical protein